MANQPKKGMTEPRRILIVKPSALGDIMHALPVASALRERFPEAYLAWVVNGPYAPLLENHPALDDVIRFDRNFLRAGLLDGPLNLLRFLSRVYGEKFDLVIDLQGLLRTGIITLATGAKQRVGLKSAREGAGWCYTQVVEDGTGVVHAVDRYWKVVEALDADRCPLTFQLELDSEAPRWAGEILRGWPRPWLAVGVGARWKTKRWLPEHFAGLVHRALTNFGGTAIFVGAPDEVALAARSASLIDGTVFDLTGKTSLMQLAALLQRCDVMIANDSGPLHLAVALGKPVVSPFTCTTVEKTGPYGQLQRGIQTRVPCQGSYLRECERMDCMTELTVDRLWPSLQEILNVWQKNRISA